jgi:hypothetical protein
MASAVANGARDAGVNVALKRVPEIVPKATARKSGYKVDQPTPLATVAELVATALPCCWLPVYALPRPLPSGTSLLPKQHSCLSTPGGSSWRGSI